MCQNWRHQHIIVKELLLCLFLFLPRIGEIGWHLIIWLSYHKFKRVTFSETQCSHNDCIFTLNRSRSYWRLYLNVACTMCVFVVSSFYLSYIHFVISWIMLYKILKSDWLDIKQHCCWCGWCGCIEWNSISLLLYFTKARPATQRSTGSRGSSTLWQQVSPPQSVWGWSQHSVWSSTCRPI